MLKALTLTLVILGLSTTVTGDYIVVNQQMNWPQALAYCQANYYNLASVHSALDNAKLTALVNGGNHWIGLCQRQEGGEPDEGWQWSDGSVYNYEMWANNEPNNSGEEDCGHTIIQNNLVHWNDDKCLTYQLPFVCETSDKIVIQVANNVSLDSYTENSYGLITKDKTQQVVGVKFQYVSGHVACGGGSNGQGTGGENNWGCNSNPTYLDAYIGDSSNTLLWPTDQTQGYTFELAPWGFYSISGKTNTDDEIILIGPTRIINNGAELRFFYHEAMFGGWQNNHGTTIADVLLLGQGSSRAQAKGDPHFVTFDGLSYNYDGPCSYILSSNRCNLYWKNSKKKYPYPQFEVIGNQGRCSSREKNVICIHKINITIWQTSKSLPIKISLANDRIWINDKRHKLPYNDSLLFAQKEIRGMNRPVHLNVNFGLDIWFSNTGSGIFDMKISRKYSTCGLLGNNNGDMKDDIRLKNGTLLTDYKNQKMIDIMGDSWMVSRQNQELRCSLYPTTSYQSFQQCQYDIQSVKHACEQMIQKYFKKLHGKNIKKCFGKKLKYENRIDGNRIFDDCVTEICSCDDTHQKCYPHVAINEFKQICTRNGVHQFPNISWQ